MNNYYNSYNNYCNRYKYYLLALILAVSLVPNFVIAGNVSGTSYIYKSNGTLDEWTRKNGVGTNDYVVYNGWDCMNNTNNDIWYLNSALTFNDGSDYSIAYYVVWGDTSNGVGNWDLIIGSTLTAGAPTSNDDYYYGFSTEAVNGAGGDSRLFVDDTANNFDFGHNINAWSKVCMNITDFHATVSVNDTTNQSETDMAAPQMSGLENIFIFTFEPGVSVCDYRVWEGTCNSEPAPPAPSAPVVTLVYPTNQSNMTSATPFNGSIVLTTDIVSNCSINYTTSANYSNGTEHRFDLSSTPEGNYTVSYSCNRTIYWNNATFWFFKDETYPVRTLSAPGNGATYSDSFWIDLSVTDTNLYAVNVSIVNNTDNVSYYYRSSGAITNGSTSYTIHDYFNVTAFPNDTITTLRLFIEATDSHTATKFNEKIKATKSLDDSEYNQLEYELDYSDLTIEYPKDLDIITTKETDRFILSFISEKRGKQSINIQSKKIEYLVNSEYLGHFIIYGKDNQPKYWLDFEGLLVTDIKQVKDNKYKITYIQTKDVEVSRSLGGLNYINWTTTFQVNKNANNVILNVSGSIIEGYCNLTGLDNMTYEYTWFRNDINISSGLMPYIGEEANFTVYYNNLSGYLFENFIDWRFPYNFSDGNYETYSRCDTNKQECYVTRNTTPFTYSNINLTGGILNISMIEQNRTTDLGQCDINNNQIQVRYNSDNNAETGVRIYCWVGGVLTKIDERTMLAGGETMARIYEDGSVGFFNVSVVNSSTRVNVNNYTEGGSGTYILSCRGWNGTTYTSWYNSTPYVSSQNFTILDEITEKVINLPHNISLTIISDSRNWSNNYSTIIGSIAATDLETDCYVVQYESNDSNYYPRTYSFCYTGVSNQTIYLYLINNTDGTRIIHQVFNNLGQYANVSVNLMKQYGSNYKTVSISRTTFEGETPLYVELYDTNYRLMYTNYNGSIVYEITSPSPFLSTTTSDTVTLETTAYYSWGAIDGVIHNTSFVNVSGTMYARFFFSDTTGVLRYACLNVNHVTPWETSLYCSNCTTASSGTISCVIDHTIEGEFQAQGIVDTDSDSSWWALGFVSWKASSPARFGQEGVWLSLIIVGTLGLLGVASITGSILLLLLGLLIPFSLALVAGMTLPAYLWLAILAFIILYMVRKTR